MTLELAATVFLAALAWYAGRTIIETLVVTLNTIITRRKAKQMAEKYMARMAEASSGEAKQAEPNQGRHGHYA